MRNCQMASCNTRLSSRFAFSLSVNHIILQAFQEMMGLSLFQVKIRYTRAESNIENIAVVSTITACCKEMPAMTQEKIDSQLDALGHRGLAHQHLRRSREPAPLLVTSRIAEAAGLTVPKCDVVEVTDWLVKHSSDMVLHKERNVREPCASGLQFGSRFVGL